MGWVFLWFFEMCGFTRSTWQGQVRGFWADSRELAGGDIGAMNFLLAESLDLILF